MDLNKADRTLRNLKPRDKPYSVALGDGLSCVVASNGNRTLYLRTRLHGKVQRINLGVYPAISVKDAAAKAIEHRALMKSGLDPRVEARRDSNGDDVPKTVKQMAQRFIDGHLKAKVRERWSHEAERILNVEVLPRIGTYPLKQLRRTDLTGLVERKAAALRQGGSKGVAANRLSAVLSKLCSYAASQGWLAHDIGRSLPKPAKEESRERTLTATEMGSLWRALTMAREGSGLILPVHARILSLLALTGCRCSEIAGLNVADVDMANGVLVIRSGKTQASIRSLPICPLARGVFQEQLETLAADGQDAIMFRSPRAGKVIPSNEISRSARDIVTALEQSPWTPHDLRRTFATVLAESGIPGDVARRITGHQATDIHGRVYDRATRFEDMRAALKVVEDWIGLAANAMADDRSNVVSIRQP